jgi:hypothetical protein
MNAHGPINGDRQLPAEDDARILYCTVLPRQQYSMYLLSRLHVQCV